MKFLVFLSLLGIHRIATSASLRSLRFARRFLASSLGKQSSVSLGGFQVGRMGVGWG